MIAKRFREIRRSMGWTQSQMARHLGKTMYCLKTIEAGQGTKEALVIREMDRLSAVVKKEGLAPMED